VSMLPIPALTIAGSNGNVRFTESGTFIVPDGVTRVIVELWGAGGGGAGASSTPGCTGPFQCDPGVQGRGGGSGAYTRIELRVSARMTLDVLIGVGGTGGAGAVYSQSGAQQGTNGSSTQLRQDATVLAEADGGKADGTGGLQSSASGVVAVAGLDASPSGVGGAAVSGSITPVGTTGGAGGAAPTGLCTFIPITGRWECNLNGGPGSIGLAGYALVSW
jgi:hypothetical protein